MATNSPVIKIGQVWARDGKGQYRMTRMEAADDGRFRVFAMHPDGQDRSFGWAKKDGTPDNWDEGWHVIKDVITLDPLTVFFRSVPNGYCACNIPVPQCKYHGTSKV